jgi:hypothetical protein
LAEQLHWLLLGYHPLASSIASTDAGRPSVQAWEDRWEYQHARRQELVDALLTGLGPEVDNRTRALAVGLAHIKVAIGEKTTAEEILRLAKEGREQLEREHATRGRPR